MRTHRRGSDKAKDAFDIDLDCMFALSKRGGSRADYWNTCCNFFEQVSERTVGSLSFKQVQWLERIEDSLAGS